MIVTTEEAETADARVTELGPGKETGLLKIVAGGAATVMEIESTETGETSPVIEVEGAKVLLTPPTAVDEATAVIVVKWFLVLQSQVLKYASLNLEDIPR